MLLLSLMTLYYSFGKPVEVRKARPKPQVIITPSLPREGSVTPQKRKKSPSPAPQNNAPTPTDGVPLQFACKVCGRYVLAFYNSSVLFCLVIGSFMRMPSAPSTFDFVLSLRPPFCKSLFH